MFTRKKSHLKTKKPSASEGFTLVEVMIGTVIFVIAMMGMLGTTLLAYRYTLMSRYQERAANALISIADQFQNSPYTDQSSPSLAPKKLFEDTTASGPTGLGMAWDSDKQFFVYPGTAITDTIVQGTATDLTIPLKTVSDTDNLIVGHITREVQPFADPYAASATTTTSSMWLGTFTITYSFLGTQTIKIQVLRTVTPTDKL